MPIDNFKVFVDQVDEVLGPAEQSLDTSQRTRLRSAARKRHGNWRATAADKPVQDVATRLVAILADADAALEPAEVEALEAHIQTRLADAP